MNTPLKNCKMISSPTMIKVCTLHVLPLWMRVLLISIMMHRVLYNDFVVKSPSLTSWAPPPTMSIMVVVWVCFMLAKVFLKKAADWFLKRVPQLSSYSQLIRLLESGKNVGNTRWLKPKMFGLWVSKLGLKKKGLKKGYFWQFLKN